MIFPHNVCLGPESHSVHKLRTTKIVVEEAASPETCGTFTFSKSSRKSEISVEEVGSFSLSAPFIENAVNERKEISLNAIVVEEIESDNDVKKSLRQISIASASEDERQSVENDDEMEKLMERIQKQRNALDKIIDEESSKNDDMEKKSTKVPEEAEEETTKSEDTQAVDEKQNEADEQGKKSEDETKTMKQSKPQVEGSATNSFTKLAKKL